MFNAILSPDNLKIADEILQWAQNYLTQENVHIKRPVGSQAVCPFVGPSIENNSFFMVFHNDVIGRSEEQIEGIILGYISPFKKLGPYGNNDKLRKALLVVFPNIPKDQTHVLDIVHANIKSKFVEAGLMVGQFHENCDERGIYNRAFRVSISPYPLMAIRHMAIHDILFLGATEDWFKCYNLRYGEKFNRPETIEDYNKHLVEYYIKAKERFLR